MLSTMISANNEQWIRQNLVEFWQNLKNFFSDSKLVGGEFRGQEHGVGEEGLPDFAGITVEGILENKNYCWRHFGKKKNAWIERN